MSLRVACLAQGALLLTAVAVLGSCAYFESQTGPYQPPVLSHAPPPSGRELYLRDCAWCHGNGGRGTSRAPDLITGTNGPAFTHFMLTTGRMPIDFPDQLVRRQDPVYGPEEIDAIVAFVATLGGQGPAIPELALSSADIGLGAELYQENCAACHSTTAIGGALTQGGPGATEPVGGSELVAPSLAESTAVEIAEAMRVGPGTMPVFGETAFSDEEVDAIVRYVVYLQDPEDRGGMAIGRVGPVAEGAVGWVVGLGAMLLLVRWIGTRTGER